MQVLELEVEVLGQVRVVLVHFVMLTIFSRHFQHLWMQVLE